MVKKTQNTPFEQLCFRRSCPLDTIQDFWLLSASKPKCNFGQWSKIALKLSLYLLPKFSRVPFTVVLISLIRTMVNDTLLNFGKRYEDDLTHCYFTRLNLKKMGALQFCLPVLLEIHRNHKQKEFSKSCEGFMR